MKKNNLLITRSTLIRSLFLGIFLILFTGSLCFAAENSYTETFGATLEENGWTLNVIVGNPDFDYTSVRSKRIAFDLPLKHTYLTLTNEQTVTDNSSVEAVFENILSNEASYGVICRYSDQGWYELRINIAGPLAGSFSVMKYDPDRKAKFLNSYIEIHPGMTHIFTADIKLGLKVKNKIKLDCNGDRFKVTINDQPQTQFNGGIFTDSQFSEGAAGVTVHAYQTGSVKIDLVGFNVKGDNLPLYGQSSSELLSGGALEKAEMTTAPVSGGPDITSLSQTIAALEALLNAQATTPEIPPTEAPVPTATPAPVNTPIPAETLIPVGFIHEPEENTKIEKAGLSLTLLALYGLFQMSSDNTEIPPMDDMLPASTETSIAEPSAPEPVADPEIDALNQTMTALELMIEKQEPTPEAPQPTSVLIPTEIPLPQIETTDIGNVSTGQAVDCAQKFSFQIVYQPTMTGAVSGERANGKFLYFRSKLTNNTAEEVFVPANMFQVVSPSGTAYPLDIFTSVKTADQWDLDNLAKPVPSGKTIDFFLVFDTSGEKGSWRMLFEPVLHLQEGPVCSISFALPSVNYVD